MAFEVTQDLHSFFSDDPFTQLLEMPGEPVRMAPGRLTKKVAIQDRLYYVKLHHSLSWSECLKNLVCLRLPVVGARREYEAMVQCSALGIATLRIAGWGEQGCRPFWQRSFLLTHELVGCVQLDEFLRDQTQRLSRDVRLGLINKVAAMTRQLHQAGWCHRDLYLCHFMLPPEAWLDPHRRVGADCFLIDLHRARRYHSQRWVIKDLASLYYSCIGLPVSRTDVLRFVRQYYQIPLRALFKENKKGLQKIQARVHRLASREHKEPVARTVR